MARLPINEELLKLRSRRERLWEVARALGRFTLLQWQDSTKPVVPIETCAEYLRGLLAGGFVGQVAPQGRRSPDSFGEVHYQVLKPSVHAPRIDRGGKPVTQGLTTLAMWRAMQVLKEFDWRQVQQVASLGGADGAATVPDQTVKSYLLLLGRAGYFTVLREAVPGTPAKYRLARDSGPHAPAITRLKTVFDRNTGLTYSTKSTPRPKKASLARQAGAGLNLAALSLVGLGGNQEEAS